MGPEGTGETKKEKLMYMTLTRLLRAYTIQSAKVANRTQPTRRASILFRIIRQLLEFLSFRERWEAQRDCVRGGQRLK